MAKLTSCRVCKQLVSKKAKACPHCGENNPGPRQYGCGTLLLILFAVVIWIGVFSDDSAPPTDPAVNCEVVSPRLIAAIVDGLTVQGGGSISGAGAVRSGAHQRAWYVAARITGAGMDGAIGVWATNDLDNPGLLFSVDNIANEFSTWGDGRTTDAEFSMSDPGARESRNCVG